MNKYIKSPINWVGNKYKYLDIINSITKNKSYDCVVDMFLGSGNILLNLKCEANTYIGNDKNKLTPKLYNEIPKYSYSLEKFEDILNRYNRFSSKDDYYIFRDYWNKKYLSNTFDEEFIYETVMLLKMCSNSMVRFNPKEGYFNQGFRGLGGKKEFFTDTMKNMCIESLNDLSCHIKNKNYKFTNKDFLDYKDNKSNRLLIFDPPYILRKDMYDTDFSIEHDNKLLDLIATTESDFIYFNYLVRDGEINKSLDKVIKFNNFKVIDINDKTLAGQGRSQNIKDVREVMIINVQM